MANRLIFIPILLLAIFANAQDGVISFEPTNLDSPNSPICVNLVDTISPEVVVTDVQGRLKVYDAISLEQKASVKLDDGALTAPVYGDFDGDSLLELAVGAYSGQLMILNGQTLEVTANLTIGSPCSVQPTVVPSPHNSGRDILAIPASDGAIHCFRQDENGVWNALWKFETNAKISSPLTVGSVRAEVAVELIAGTGDGYVVICDVFNQRPHEEILVLESAVIANTPLPFDAGFGDRRDELFVVMERGELYCFRYMGSETRKLQEVWVENFAPEPAGPPTVITVGSDDVIIQPSTSAFLAYKAVNGALVASDNTNASGIATQIAIIPMLNNSPEAGYGLKQTMQVTEGLSSWLINAGSAPLNTNNPEINHRLEGAVVTAIDPDNNEVLLLGVSTEEDGMLYSMRTNKFMSEELWTTSTWTSHGATPKHVSKVDRQFFNNYINKKQREVEAKVNDLLEELQAAENAGDWDGALQIAQQLASINPYNPEFTSKERNITIRKFIIQIVIAVLIILAVLGFTGFLVFRGFMRRQLRRQGESAVARGDYEAARTAYHKLFAKVKSPKIARAYAKVLIALGDYSEESIPVYRTAYKGFPQEQEILHAFARSLLREPHTDTEARGIFEAAIQSFPEPHLLEYGLGRCELANGNYDEAGKMLRSALRGGVTSNAIYASLAEVYIHTKNFTAKALPVFEQQFPNRREDRPFLEGYLLCCIDAKKTDGNMESLCQSVLEVSPQFVPAYLHLAQILLQKNQIGAAIDEIKSALSIDANNREAHLMLATGYLMQNRKDDEALQAFRSALNHDPGNLEVLKMLTQIFYERGQFDQEAVDVYNRTLELAPNDPPALRALAQTAVLTNNSALSIRTIEQLAQIGQINQALVQQLAKAYVQEDTQEDKAERILREALRHDPNNKEFISQLARIYCSLDRTDIDCAPTLESYLQAQPNDIRAGRQLAKVFISSNRFEKALETTRRFLKVAPDDEDLQRLNAQASLYDNKIDEAISEYVRLLERNPQDPDALVNLALAYGQKMRTDSEAVSYYTRALNIQPKNDMLHMAMARAQVAANNLKDSVDHYKKALSARENNEQNVISSIQNVLADFPEALRVRWFLVEQLVNYGHLRDSLEQIEFIAAHYPNQSENILRAVETILSKDRKNVAALSIQGSMLLNIGKLEDAAMALEEAFNLRPNDAEIQEKLIAVYQKILDNKDNPEYRFKMGQVYYNQQEYDAAIGAFQQTAQNYQWEAESTKMLGKCFTGKGMLDFALEEYKKLVVDEEAKELLYDLAQRFEAKKDLVGAKTVYRQLFAADINYKDVKQRFEMLSGSTSDPMAFEKTSIVQQMSEEAARRYELLDELGRGAMGIVYRARDKELDEIVALKILPDAMSNNPEAVRRFKIEARNARKLSHPNIVRIHDIGEEMGRKYISMEYVDGSDLKKKMKSAQDFKLPIDKVIHYAMHSVDALGYAHRLGIVHRDIKPANIMLTQKDEVKITDFGIAKLLDADAAEGTMVGAVIGTPLYMSPEQVQGVPVDNRADLYSFGIMFYELLNGRPPFTEGDLAYQHIHREPDPIEGIPEELWKIVSKCLEKNKEDRYEKAEIIYDEIREFSKAKGYL